MDYRTLTKELEEQLHLESASPEAKEEALIHIGDTIIERTMLAIVENLTEDESEMASKHLKEGDIEGFLLMIDEKHPELHDKVVAITQEVINEFNTYLQSSS
jgi:hypothetical protein